MRNIFVALNFRRSQLQFFFLQVRRMNVLVVFAATASTCGHLQTGRSDDAPPVCIVGAGIPNTAAISSAR